MDGFGVPALLMLVAAVAREGVADREGPRDADRMVLSFVEAGGTRLQPNIEARMDASESSAFAPSSTSIASLLCMLVCASLL